METAVLVAAADVMSFMVFPFVSYMWSCNKFVVCINSSLHPRARSCSVSIKACPSLTNPVERDRLSWLYT